MLSNKSLFLILILFGIVFTFENITGDVYGHGLTSDILQSETFEGHGVLLNLYSTTSPTEQNHREIFFELIDSETDELINEVTFLIKVSQNEKTIFENSFESNNGVLILDMDMINKTFSIIEQRDSKFDDPQKLKNAKMKNIPNLLNEEVSGGLYDFEIQISTAGSYSEQLEDPIVFDSGLSFPSSEFFEINTPNYGVQEFGLIGYYDRPYDFDYNAETREIMFLMPYSWPEHTEDDQFFVHNEILIPKSFGDLRYENFSAYVNGIDQTESIFNVDFALEKDLQVHLVTQWDEFNELSEKLKDENGNLPSVLEYLFVPTDPDAPFSSLTHGGRYRINLDWEPQEIVAGSETKFIIEILDIYTKDKPVPTDYHFTVIHDNEEIFHKSDVSTNPVTKTTELDFLVPEDVSGPITIRFENLGGGIFSNLDFPAIIYPSDDFENDLMVNENFRPQSMSIFSVVDSSVGIFEDPKTKLTIVDLGSFYGIGGNGTIPDTINVYRDDILWKTTTKETGIAPSTSHSEWQIPQTFFFNELPGKYKLVSITNNTETLVFEFIVKQITESEKNLLYPIEDDIHDENYVEYAKLAPLKQIQSGVMPKDIVCKEHLNLVFKTSNNDPVCLMPATAEKLIDRGWGTFSK